jgi:preprotein translocase subunit SecG
VTFGYFIFFSGEDEMRIVKEKDVTRLTNFLAVIFFAFALIFDLYKW